MDVLVLSTDLIVTSLVGGAARRRGMRFESAGSAAALLERLAKSDAGSSQQSPLLLIDLSTTGLNVGELVKSLREQATPVRVFAFGPHVHEQRLAEARDAGCDRVLSRGQFQAQIDALVAGE